MLRVYPSRAMLFMDLSGLLKGCHLFHDLDRHKLDAVRRIAHLKKYTKREIIFHEGDPSRGFFLVVAGTVKIYRLGTDGREGVLHVVEPGETFAEATIFMDTFPATAEVLTPTATIIFFEKVGFIQLLARDPRLSLNIISALVKWLRRMRDMLTDLTLKEVPARFASYVLGLEAKQNSPIEVSLSKTTLAQILGTSRETFSRLLRRLAEHRVLVYRGNQIRVLDRNRLVRIAGGEEKI